MKKEGKLVEFSTKTNKYIFDPITGEVIPSQKWTGYIISNYYKLEKTQMLKQNAFTNKEIDEFEEEYRYVKNLIRQGMFYYPETVKSEKEMEEYIYNANSSQLILVLT